MEKSQHSSEYLAIVNKLAAMRKAAGLSQRALAARLSVVASWVSKVETGERRLDIVEFCWFCHACGREPSAVMEELSDVIDARFRDVEQAQNDEPDQ